MRFERYEETTGRKRLSGSLQSRGTPTGMSSVGMFLVGLPFFGVGVWVTLMGAKSIPLDESKLHGPHWVLAMVGVVFALGGMMVWSRGWRQFKANRRRSELEMRDPALTDYPWNPRGFAPPRWSRAAKGMGTIIFLALILLIFNWWAFFAKGPWMVKIIAGIFDLILVLAACQVGMVIGRTVRFGPSRIEFARFPFRPGETVSLHWLVPQGMSRATNGTFTLRCVEEWYEVTGSGKSRKSRLVQEQIWSVTAHLDQPQDILPGRMEELRFDIPAEAPGTSLGSRDTKPVFWELVVDLDLAGLDFKESYLVPVYRWPAS